MAVQIKHVSGSVEIRGLQGMGILTVFEEEATRLCSDDMKAAIADAKRHNADVKKRKIEELETELRKLKESLVVVDVPRKNKP